MQTLKEVNPITDPGFVPGDRWAQANSLRGGATLGTCGQHPETYDPRPYAIALQETGYPNLRNLFHGQWELEDRKDCLRLFRDATFRGSYPLSVVGLLLLQCHPESRRQSTWEALDERQQKKLVLHLALAQGDPEFRRLFREQDQTSKAIVAGQGTAVNFPARNGAALPSGR